MFDKEIDSCTPYERREDVFKSRYPVIYDEICKILLPELSVKSWQEKIYIIRHYDQIATLGKCPQCGKPTSFDGYSKGYRQFCSYKCAFNSGQIREKIRQTSLVRYGTESPNQAQSVKNKQRQSTFEHYGVYCPFQSSEVKKKSQESLRKNYGVDNPSQSDVIKRRKIETCKSNFGCDFPMQSDVVRGKSVQTCLEKYGTEYAAQSDVVQNEMKQTSLARYGVEHYAQSELSKQQYINNYIKNNKDVINVYFDSDGNRMYTCSCPHPECNKCTEQQYDIISYIYANRKQNNVEPCSKILPAAPDRNQGTSIELFVRNILDENGIKYITNTKDIINGKELDIYISDHRLAIECNGCYWHSDEFKDKHYHYNKWIECKRRGIRLLSVWDDQIIVKPLIVKSIILSKLGIYERKLMARKCELREIDKSEYNEFMLANHLQGPANSKVRLGLYSDSGELVSVMSFGLKRVCMGGKENEWELIRYCSKRGVQVSGAAGKLLNHFIKEYHPVAITSFSSNDISDGEMYKRLGFMELPAPQSISYWYVDTKNNVRYHRYNFRKDVLVKEGYSPSLTESEIMHSRGYVKIYDSGQSKWMMSINQENSGH